jgi:hypothetical protein
MLGAAVRPAAITRSTARSLGGGGAGVAARACSPSSRKAATRRQLSGAADWVRCTSPALAMSSRGRSWCRKSQLLELAGWGAHRRDQQVRQATVPGLQLAQAQKVVPETGPRIGVSQRLLGCGEVLGHRAQQCRLHQFLAGGEPAVERRVAHAGPAGDLVQRGAQAVLGEHRTSSGNDRVTVAGCVGTEAGAFGVNHHISLSGNSPRMMHVRRQAGSTPHLW